MKKTLIVSSVSFAFLTISSAVAYLLRFAAISDPWLALLIALVTLGVSAAVALAARRVRWLNAVCFAVSAAALGFALRAWYVFRNFDNPFWQILLVSFGCVIYLIVYYLFSLIPPFSRNLPLFTAAWLILSLVAYLLLVFLTTTTWVSTFGYYMLIEIAFILAMYSKAASIGELIRSLALSTFAVFGVIVFIAVIMLSGDASGCDCDCSGCDCDCGIGDSKSKKSKGDVSSEIKP